MLYPDHDLQYQIGTSTETPIWESICRWNKMNGRSEPRTGKGGRKDRRRTKGNQEGTDGSHPEKGLGGRVLSKRRRIRHRNAGFSLRSPLPEDGDLYITSGIQTMAISRKRPSAGSPTEDHHEDSRPSKKTATSKYNVQSSEGLLFPKSGPVPVISMILYFGEQEETARALLDTGSTVPILSLSFMEKHQVPIAERATQRTIQDYAGQEVPGAGEYFTSPLLLQHRQHFTRVSFKVAPLAGDDDIILPRWWLAKHKCDLLASNG